MKEKCTIRIAILKEHLDAETIMDALAPIARCTSTIHDNIIHITAVTELTRSNHPDNACALTADIISELETEEEMEAILEGLGCCFVLMPEEQIQLTPDGYAQVEGLSDLLSSIHQVREKSNDLVHYVATQDVGFAMRRVLFYSGNALFRVLLQEEKALDCGRASLTPDSYQSVMRFWAYGEYKDHPLCFVDIGCPTPEQVVRILTQYDEWYGNTDQDTEVYALEFQILTRMLLTDGKLLVNPKYLDTTEHDVIDWQDTILADIGAPVTKDGLTAFSLVRRMSQNEINAFYRITIHEPPLLTDGNCFVYGGYHFTPLQQVIGKNIDMKALVRRIASDTCLGFSTYHWRRFPYSYDDFYKAAGTIGAGSYDLFRCIETGLVYIPDENELFIYSGKVDETSI